MDTPKQKVVKSGLEFVPLRDGETEAMYRVSPGRPHPGQQEFVLLTRQEKAPYGSNGK